MKHLRRFNESLKQELQDFCETNLAYLIDEGFMVRVTKFEGDDYHQIVITCGKNRLWSEMKDQVLPFLHFLFKDYELYYDNGVEIPMGIFYHHNYELQSIDYLMRMNLTLDKINDLPDDTEVSTLFIRVVKK